MQGASELSDPDPMELCEWCVTRMGLPPFAANPLVARSLLSHRGCDILSILDAVPAEERDADANTPDADDG